MMNKLAIKASGLYYKNITTVNDTSRVVIMMILTDAPSWSNTYNYHSDDSRGVIYIPSAIYYAPRAHS